MWIKTYILTIITVVIFSAMAEAIMPETNMKKHVSLIVGLLVLFAIAKPVIAFPKLSMNDILFRFDEAVTTSGTEISNKIEEEQIKTVNQKFSKELSSAISKSINKNCNINCDVETIIEDNYVVAVKIFYSENETIKNFINQTYGFKCVFIEDD